MLQKLKLLRKFAFEATKNNVTKPLNDKPKPFRRNKAFKRKKEKGRPNKNIRSGIIFQMTGVNRKTLATTMKISNTTRNFPDVATKPTEHKQTNASPTIQFFPENYFSISYILGKKSLAGIELQTLGHKSIRVTSGLSGKMSPSC